MQGTEHFFIYTDGLNSLGARYMVSGSVASIFYGEPRLTNDIDIVIELEKTHVPKLLELFPQQNFYHPPEEVIRVELSRAVRGHFNLIHHKSGFKADIYPISGNPLHHWALPKAREIQIGQHRMMLAPPEYVILRKLEFYREGGSEKHLRDIRSMLDCLTDSIDFIELKKLLAELHLDRLWNELKL